MRKEEKRTNNSVGRNGFSLSQNTTNIYSIALSRFYDKKK
jgi:hypothetical protein